MKLKALKYFVIIFSLLPLNVFCQKIYSCHDGFIQFNSNAPEEFIKAYSNKLSGALNPESKAFAFKIPISSFEGFNAALQKEHFNEKYMESDKFPAAEFSGKIIEDVDFTKDGTYDVRAKGILKIHDIEQERIIKSSIKIVKGMISIKSSFDVILKDHNIKVPKVVHEKIATDLFVEMHADLIPFESNK